MKSGSLGSNSAHAASTDLQLLMSVIGPKLTSLVALHMSAVGLASYNGLRSLLGFRAVKGFRLLQSNTDFARKSDQ